VLADAVLAGRPNIFGDVMAFTAEQVEDLYVGLAEMKDSFDRLQDRCVMREFRDERAQEYARHGFTRRLNTLRRCIEHVFESLPPERVDFPSRDELGDATIFLQAFVLNTFGCCDNLAWIWVLETGVTKADGGVLENKMVGMGARYRQVRNSLPPALRDYLATRQDWLDHLTSFRDALAHRIPLYIPPSVVIDDNADAYRGLMAASDDALRRGDFAEYHKLQAELRALSIFYPAMAHSLFERGGPVPFHPQVLADFATIVEMAGKILDELDRVPPEGCEEAL
jgi:hypothetical protein